MNFFISDLHLDHQNIIKYCNRPFTSVGEMNRILVENWNETVNKNDIVFFLGDLAFGRNPLKWLEVLNGNVVFIKGSHDFFGFSSLVLNVGFNKFLLIHNPYNANGWRDWIIHGHIHNNDLINYPFINKDKKTINVSAELVGYKPISLDIKRLKRIMTSATS